MSKTTRILICDDDPIVHQSLSLYLDHEDFLHDSAYDGKQALEMIKKEHYDLMLLDQMMPGMTGMEVCQAVRKDSQLPIIMLTARGEEIDRILGLEMGADDYIVKPFSPREVVSRIKAVLRRTCAAPDTAQEEKLTTLTFGSLEIQPERYSVKLAGQSIACTPREVELLYLLASHPGRVFDREQNLSVSGATISSAIRARSIPISSACARNSRAMKWARNGISSPFTAWVINSRPKHESAQNHPHAVRRFPCAKARRPSP